MCLYMLGLEPMTFAVHSFLTTFLWFFVNGSGMEMRGIDGVVMKDDVGGLCGCCHPQEMEGLQSGWLNISVD